MTEEVKNEVDYKLPPEKQKILAEIIENALDEYDKESKFYTADTLHYLRSKVTSLAKKQLGDEIHSIDIILDLRHVQHKLFGFKVNIPVPKEEK
jgi:hypothetical protein